MNFGTETRNSLDTIDNPRPFAETSSTPLPSLLQEQIPSMYWCSGCTPEPEPGCSRIVSDLGPDIAAQRGDTVVPETEVNIRQNTSRDDSPDP